MVTIDKLRKEVKKRLSLNRFEHSERVANMSEKLSKIWNGDTAKLIYAAYLHDIARDMPTKDLVKIVKENGYRISKLEYAKPVLLHSLAGTIIAETIFGVNERNFKEANIVRKISFKNLKEAVLKETEFNACFLMNKRKLIHPYSIEMFNDLLKNEILP